MKDISVTIKLEAIPVAVYCTVKKKCVMLFSSNKMCDKYVFDQLIYGSSRTRYLTSANGKTDKNVFKKVLAFRCAKIDQVKQLDGKDVMILDEEYYRYDVKLNSQMGVVRIYESANPLSK